MAKFHDTLDSIGFQDDAVTPAYPDTFMDDIRASYDEDFSIPAAKITTLEAELAAATAEIARLKAHNYDLITAGPAPSPEGEEDPTEPDADEEKGENDDEDGVAGLFKSAK